MATEIAIAEKRQLTTAPRLGMGPPETLSRRQKAAIVVRLLLAEGASLPLRDLPDSLQAELTTQISQMRYVDRETLKVVVEEFASELDSIGLSFPGGLDGALKILDGAISPEMAARLRQQSGALWADDPWDTLAEIESEKLLPLLERESPEIAAVILSKLKISKAAELLGCLSGDRARRLTLAVSETADISPDVVRRIGLALAAELKAEPPRAFPADAAQRLGAILNISDSASRDDLLAGLDEEEPDFAARLRKAIFTFADIPARLQARDVPAVMKSVPQEILVQVIAAKDDATAAAVDFILDNTSKRMGDALREEAAEIKSLTAKQADAARLQIVAAIRDAVDRGLIELVEEEEMDEAA